MKVLVSTDLTQGYRENDTCDTPIGEIVLPVFIDLDEEEKDRNGPDAENIEVLGDMGFMGVLSRRFTSTSLVVDRPVAEVAQMLIDVHNSLIGVNDFETSALEVLYKIEAVANWFDIGDIIEKCPKSGVAMRRTNLNLLLS